ncbi:MAG TPA: hypothetical protein VMU50_23975 [Polyangia bacterium]|nr:hypothetical protein [Polyangia bacterium]
MPASPPTTVRSLGARRGVWKLYLPLVTFVVPTVIIGFGVLIPRSCIAGFNELTLGFGSTVFFACVTYVVGVRAALKG